MSLFSPILWAFLPGQLADILVPYLSSVLPGVFPPAPKGTTDHQRNYRWAYSLIVVGYLAWTFGASTGDGHGQDWYAILGVPVDVDDDGLKRAYRTLSRVYHPDRSPNSSEIFIFIRKAYEGLSDPVKRFAYDRFGPATVDWKAASYREYMRQGIMQSVGFYATSAAIMFALQVMGRARDGQYWRNTLFVCLFVAEGSLILSNTPLAAMVPASLSPLLPGITTQPTFLQIRFLHRAFTSLSIGLTQLAGVWADRPNEERILAEMQSAIQSLQVEARGAFGETVMPLMSRGNPLQVEKLLVAGMEQALVDRAVSTHPQIRPFWQEAIVRSRTEAKRDRHRHPTDALYPYGYAPPAYSTVQSYAQQDMARDVKAVEADLGVARGVPLPDSPPGSPVPGYRTL